MWIETCFDRFWFDASTTGAEYRVHQNSLREAISIHEANLPAANLVWLFRYGVNHRGLSPFVREPSATTPTVQMVKIASLCAKMLTIPPNTKKKGPLPHILTL